MKLTLNQIENQFEVLEKSLLSSIKGGKGIKLSDDQLKQLFDYSNINGGFSSNVAKSWNKMVRELASTDAGASLLKSLASYSSEKIILDDISSTGDSAGEYSHATNKIKMGKFSSYDIKDTLGSAQALSLVAHEMYHAFQDLFWHKWDIPGNQGISAEVDAYLFESRVLKQRGYADSANLYYDISGFGAIINDANKNGGVDFRDAWKRIIDDGIVSLTDYNTLIDHFQSTSVGLSPSYVNQTKDTKTSLTDVQIFAILNNHGDVILRLVDGVYTPTIPQAEVTFGTDWDSSDPFNNPYDYGYDPQNESWQDWFGFYNSNYEGDGGDWTEPTENNPGDNGPGDGDPYKNNSDYIEEWYNPETGSWQYVYPGDSPQEGFIFHHSQDPNNYGGYDENGYNPMGYDANGYDVNGYDKNGFDELGMDSEGYDENGYDHYGYDRNGYDEWGYDEYGYDEYGYDEDGFDEYGYDWNGYDAQGYDEWGMDPDGNTREDNGDYD